MNLSEQFSEKEIRSMRRFVKKCLSLRRLVIIVLGLSFIFCLVCSILYLSRAYQITELLGIKVSPFSFISHIDPDKLYPGKILRIYHGVSMFINLIGVMILNVIFIILIWKEVPLKCKCFKAIINTMKEQAEDNDN